MAMVDLATSLPDIQQRSLDSPFTTMDRRTIDLNQHAFDLNEVPLSDTTLDCHEGLSSENIVSSLIPRKGGWLELFCNMFGQDKVVHGGAPFGPWGTVSDSTCLNNVSVTETKPYIDPRLHSNGVLNNDKGRHSTVNGYAFGDNLCHEHRQSAVEQHLPFGVVGQTKCETLSLPFPPFNSHTADIPLWDLNSNPMSQQKKEIVSTKASSMASSSSCRELAYDSRKSMQDLLVCVMNSPGHRSQLSDVLQANVGQDNGPSEQEECGFIASSDLIGRRNGLIGLKGNGASGTSNGQESENSEDPQSSTMKDGKMEEPRIRIVPSPDWLPAGWITEVKTRKAGSTAGTTDKYYKDPVTGRRCRSRNEVMNFLQTGRLGRNKPQFRALDGLAAITTMPLLPPLQEHKSGEPYSSHAVALKQTFLPQMLGVPTYPSLSSPGLVLDRLSEGQEQEEPVPGVCEAQDAGICMEMCKGLCLQGRAQGEAVLTERTDISRDHGCSNVEFHQEPGHLGKRKLVPDSALGLLSKRICYPVVPRQHNGNLCTRSFFRTGGVPANLGAGIPPFTRLSQAKGPHACPPDSFFNQEETVPKPFALTRALGLCPMVLSNSASRSEMDRSNELRLRTGSVSKNVENRFPKLTLKQERELLLSLGRKLCQEFVEAVKEEVKG